MPAIPLQNSLNDFFIAIIFLRLIAQIEELSICFTTYWGL
jgi:hypothetical protein